jgi:hypothetical protein
LASQVMSAAGEESHWANHEPQHQDAQRVISQAQNVAV